jgi:hypothetical protein
MLIRAVDDVRIYWKLKATFCVQFCLPIYIFELSWWCIAVVTIFLWPLQFSSYVVSRFLPYVTNHSPYQYRPKGFILVLCAVFRPYIKVTVFWIYFTLTYVHCALHSVRTELAEQYSAACFSPTVPLTFEPRLDPSPHSLWHQETMFCSVAC